MPYQNRYEDPQKVAEYLSQMDFAVLSTGAGDFSPEHVKYDCELKSGSHEFRTAYQSNPSVHGEPTVADVFSALVSDALTVQNMGLDDFADELGFDKPSAAIRAYDACKKTLDWLRTDLYLDSYDISAMSETLDGSLDEVKQAVATLQQERAEKEAFEHPPVPRGFVTIDSLEEDLNLGEYGDQCPDYAGEYVSDCFTEVADSNVDIYTYDLLKWLPDNYEWLEEADAQGLLEGCKGDLNKMTQMAQYECFTQDMYDHREDICKLATLESLKESGLYAVSTDMAESILGDIDYEDGDRFSDYLDEAETMITDGMEASLAESFGDELAASEAMENVYADHNYACVNPCAMSVEAVRTVNEKGYDAAFTEQWKGYMPEPGKGDASPSLGEVAAESRASSSELAQGDAPGGGRDALEQPDGTEH